jgi:phenylalanine-4-hydroxylase
MATQSPIVAPMPSANRDGDAFIDQDWRRYTPDEHRLWSALHGRQRDDLEGRACDAFLRGLDVLDLDDGGIPDFERLNPRIEALTGWRIEAVTGLVPDAVFFDRLSRRRFPAARFLRAPDQLDYLSEPDVFHDVFGHVPMLTDPVFADYMQAYGAGGLRALGADHLRHLARLYWHTVEFGLMRDGHDLKIYGAGIVSSHGETRHALEAASPLRLDFEMERVMRTPYRIDRFQQTYFVIPSLPALLEATLQDFGGLYRRLDAVDDLEMDTLAPGDRPWRVE